MKHTNKKGFTIVELVIVIAVIAILAAVLIPTFSNLIKKANESSDIQAVRQMNTILAAEGAVENNNIFEVFAALQESNLDANGYKPLVSGHYFFWDDEADCIVYTDANYDVIFPKDYEKAADANWFSLTQKIEAKAPTGFTAESTAVTVKTGAEMVYVLEQFNANKTSKTLKITIDGTVDMMGAAFSVPYIGTPDDSVKGYNIEITGGTIKNATAINVSDTDGKNNKGETGEGHDGMYGCSLFGIVRPGNTLNIHDVTFENVNIKNTHASGAAILVGAVYSKSVWVDGTTTVAENGEGKVQISNVTISNSTVIGHRSVGALVGINQGTVELSGNIALEKVNVLAVGGRSGLLLGQNGSGSSADYAYQSFTSNAAITASNCAVAIYECAQNTGTYNGTDTDGVGKTLGDVGNGKNSSWCYTYDEGAGKWVEEYRPGDSFNPDAVKGTGHLPVPTVTGWN